MHYVLYWPLWPEKRGQVVSYTSLLGQQQDGVKTLGSPPLYLAAPAMLGLQMGKRSLGIVAVGGGVHFPGLWQRSCSKAPILQAIPCSRAKCLKTICLAPKHWAIAIGYLCTERVNWLCWTDSASNVFLPGLFIFFFFFWDGFLHVYFGMCSFSWMKIYCDGH